MSAVNIIQKIVDALPPEGGLVKLAAKTYTIRNRIILRDGVTIQGAGIDKTIIRMAAGAAAAETPDWPAWMKTWRVNDYPPHGIFANEKYNSELHPEGNHDISIKDLAIDGNADKNPYVGEGISLANNTNYRIENVHVRNCRGFAGIITWPNARAADRRIPNQNCILNCVVEKNQPARDRDQPYGHGIYITYRGNENVLIKGCICRHNAGSGIFLEDNVKHIRVEDCQSYDNRMYGIWLVTCTYSTIRNSKIFRNLRGVMCITGSNYNFICENEIFENRLEGIYLGPYATAEGCDDRRDIKPAYNVIAGNIVRNNNQSFQDAGAGVLVEFRRNLIAHNHVSDDQTDKTQFIGIIVYAPENLVINNYLRPQAYPPGDGGEFVDMTATEDGPGQNTFIPCDYSKPWSREDPVDG